MKCRVLPLGLALGMGLLLLGGCSGTPPAESETQPAAPVGTRLDMSVGGDDLRFEAPPSWISETPTSSMRLSQYRIPGAGAEAGDGQLVVFHFGGQGGDTQANVDRWIGQFTSPDGAPVGESARVQELESNGLKLTQVDVSGTYNESRGPMMGETTARPDYRMLAVVVEGPGGPWFLKLTGPRSTIDSSEEEFSALLQTLRVGS